MSSSRLALILAALMVAWWWRAQWNRPIVADDCYPEMLPW